MRNIYRTFALILSILLSWQTGWADNQYGLKDNIQDGVILHCFDWTVAQIEAEIPNIAKAGFTAVQTSPVHQREGQSAWYMAYQPYDFAIGNSICSDAAALTSLCTTAHQYGVKVIVDVVANHTNGNLQYVAPFWQNTDLYHTYGSVSNWNDRYQVTHGEIGMKDLKTEDSRVQEKIHSYIETLKSCGVDGIRWDAAKHIGLPSEGDSFWQNVPDQSMYNYGEILDGTGGSDNSLFPEYQRYISITDNGYGNGFTNSFNSGQVNSSIGNFNQRGASTSKLVYWAESHDTYANGSSGSSGLCSTYMSQNTIDRSWAVVAGNNGATALYFSRPSQTGKDAIRLGEKGSTHFTAPEVAEVNHFHNACTGEPNYYVHENGVAAQVRKTGATIVLGSGGNSNVSVANGAGDGQWLKPGTYTDHVSNNTFTVTSSTISGQVGSTGIAVLYTAVPSTAANITLTPNGGTFTTETQSVTITPNDNTKSYWYKVGNGTQTSVSSNTTSTITIGEGVSYGSSITLSWGASNSEGEEVTGSATFNKVKEYEPTLSNANEISCFFETSKDNVKAWVWTDAANYTGGTWPGESMTLVGKTANGNNVFKWTYTGSLTAIPTSIIFTHDGETKFDSNDGTFTNHGYYTENSATTSTKTVTKIDGGGTPTPTPEPTDDYEPYLESSDELSVFFETNDGNVPSVWVWGSGNVSFNTNGTWPGDQMTLQGTLSGGAKVYKWTSTKTGLPTGIIFTHDGGTKYNEVDGTFTNHGYYTISSAATSTKTVTKVGNGTSPDANASVSISPASGTTFTSTLSVTIKATNATSAWYSVNGGTHTAFTSSATFTIGSDVIKDSLVIVSWGATGSDNKETTGSATYIKSSGSNPAPTLPRLTANDISIAANGTADVTVSLETETQGGTVEFTLTLPDGIDIEQDDAGYVCDKGNLLRRGDGIDITKNSNGSYRFEVIPTTNKKLETSDGSLSGTLITLSLKAGQTETGTYQGKISNITVVKPGGGDSSENIGNLSDISFSIAVSSTMGDANGDGEVNTFDLQSVLDNFGNAGGKGDANHDGVVNVFDLQSVLDNLD